MPRCGCSAVEQAGCQCSFDDTNCIQVTGTGSSSSPFAASPILDPDSDNLLSCGASGLLAKLDAARLDPPSVSAFRQTAQSISTGAATAVSMTAEDWDTDSMHDLVTNNERVVANTTGIYAAEARASFDNNATGIRELWIQANGSEMIARVNNDPGVNDFADLHVSDLWLADTVGDYLRIIVFQNSGGALDIQAPGGDTQATGLRVCWLRPEP